MSSIENDHEPETAETSAELPLGDDIAGPDIESAKTSTAVDISKDTPDAPHHARSNSVKKPTAFKAVSVTKNFLAKAGTPSTSNAKVNGDKGMSATATATTPLAPRPRLVAKTASGHQASAPKASGPGHKNGGSGPDPMQVWNKNRAAPQAPPKQLTDEELKQRYGIHLATRLQADADGKEAKWADIDDDEDDWAPDTIEWTDGTKISLSHNDPAAALAEQQAAAAAEQAKQEEERKAKMAPPKPTTSVGPNAKVLKVGANAQPKQGGITLKTYAEKPTLVAKPTPPAAVKSPWASLPPVDKVPPVAINPPAQTPGSRPQQAEPIGVEPTQPPVPSPAMEIAADSFTRTPRDIQGASQGQLYNSQSGRYEPVTARRGSMRSSQNFRRPEVLQRPSQQDQQGPAEPSASFQTQRSGSQQDGASWDRRASSTVSGGSGPHGRRISLSRETNESQPLESPGTPGVMYARPANGVTSSQVAQISSSLGPRNSQQVNDLGTAVVSPQAGHSQPADGAPIAQNIPETNAQQVRAQQQVMKEKRELAIKRKKEEEAREEAAKRERIRIKLEQLEIKEQDQKGPAKKESEVKQVVKRAIEQNNLAPPALPQDPVPAAEPQSPPKPPMPDSSGAPRQYGMMKVHGPALANGISSVSERPNERPSERLSEETSTLSASNQRISPPKVDSIPRPEERLPSPMADGDFTKNRRGPSAPGSPNTRSQHLYRPQRQQPWNNVQRDTDQYASGWSSGAMTTHSPTANLWGPPANHKALGNGTFDRNIQRPSSRQAPYQEHHVQTTPQPIGPPRNAQKPRESPDTGPTPFVNQGPVIEDFQTMPSFPLGETPPGLSRVGEIGGRSIGAEQAIVSSQPSPGVQARPHISPDRLAQGQDSQRSSLSAWSNFQATSAKEEAEKKQQAAQQHALRLAEEARTGMRYEPQLPVLNETWRQVKVDEDQRRVVGVNKGQHPQESKPGPNINGDLRLPPFTSQSPMGPATGAGRGSRFFPTAGQGFLGQQRAVSYSMEYSRSPSPPPPDSVQHPAYARSQPHPLVNLPITKPKPTVKLPPSMSTAPSTPMMAQLPAAPLRAVSQPLVNNPSWQDRFDGLLGIKSKASTSPEKKFADFAGFSETKVPLESPALPASAAVSLPSKDKGAATEGLSTASKVIEDEEALFEEREFGSLPVVSLPTRDTKWQKAKSGKHHKTRRPPAKEADTCSREPFLLGPDEGDQQALVGLTIFVNLPGMVFPRSRTIPRPNAPVTSQAGRGHRNFSGNAKHGKGLKPRESSGNFGNQKPTPNGPPSVQMPRTPNALGRGNWGKNANNWANRLATNVA
ncbi:MAG: hypothetical protein Q9191_003660 [Dirinaria sp. TL-2023a]